MCDSRPVAALAGVPVDEAGLAAVQVGVPLEALEVGGLICHVLIQTIRPAAAEGSNRILGCGGTRGGGGFRGEALQVNQDQDQTG